ncbi:hypothetical protein Tco_1191837 [Tanacetum coccineum]
MENYQDPLYSWWPLKSGQMLLDKINCEEFFKLQDEDAVAVCQLAVLHLILLGRQPAHNIPEWWFRLSVLMALQEAHDEEACLEEQILGLMHRFADRFTNRRPEIK